MSFRQQYSFFFSICMKSFLFGVICNSNRTNVFGQKSCLSSISPCGLRITFCRCDSNRVATSSANLSEQKKVFFKKRKGLNPTGLVLVKNPVWVPSRQQCLAYNFLKSFAVLGTSFRLLSFQIHIRFLLTVHTFHHPPLVTQIDSVLRLNIMKSPGCNAWRDEPMCVCCNDRCVDAK